MSPKEPRGKLAVNLSDESGVVSVIKPVLKGHMIPPGRRSSERNSWEYYSMEGSSREMRSSTLDRLGSISQVFDRLGERPPRVEKEAGLGKSMSTKE